MVVCRVLFSQPKGSAVGPSGPRSASEQAHIPVELDHIPVELDHIPSYGARSCPIIWDHIAHIPWS